jgi:Transposase and inactivated derivatives, IS30 family
MEREWSGNPRRLSRADLAEIERLIFEGATFEKAAAAAGCSTRSIQRFLASTGGLKRRLKVRSPLRLSLAEREELSRGLVAGDSLRAIAMRLRRAPSTISRDVAWSGSRSGYRAWRADRDAVERGRRPKPAKLALDARLCREVERGLRAEWSPQQIAARLIRDYPDDLAMRVSHETIYKTLFIQARGALRKELTSCLRTGRAQRRPHMRTEQSGAGRIRNPILISDRPPDVEDRAVPGHWEGDLIIGKGGRSAIGVLVERASRYVVLLHLPHGRTAEDVRAALTRQVSKMPAELRRTLTWDQGKEMAEHVRFSTDTNMVVYFCDPHSPWQRGTGENTNGLLRQYFPRTSDLSLHSAAHLNAVARELNGRPRQTLNWMKPSEVFSRTVASTD